MKAIILAAGIGSRLKHLTDNTPKCLLEINSKTVLEHQIETLRQWGIQDITMVVGFRAKKIKDFCKERSWNINFIYNRDYIHSNNFFSLWLAREQFGRGFVCLNSDVLFDAEILRGLLKYDGDICAVVDQKYCTEEDMKVALGDGIEKIVKISKKMRSEKAYGEFIGMIKFSQKGATRLLHVLDTMPASQVKTMFLGSGIQKLIDSGYKVRVFNAQKRPWTDIDFIEDLMEARARRW